MTIQELKNLSERDFIAHIWGNDVLSVIDNQTTVPMTMDEFLKHCTPCGGNWGGMLLTGLQELYPEVYDAIPDEMGKFAWSCICDTLYLLNIKS
jgi:hypothetical protein